jgi:hypothetical protein
MDFKAIADNIRSRCGESCWRRPWTKNSRPRLLTTSNLYFLPQPISHAGDRTFKRFQILYHTSRLWYVESLSDIVTARAKINNMVCEERRASYTGTCAVCLLEYKTMPTEAEGLAIVWPLEETTARNLWRAHLERIEEPEQNLALTTVLIRYQNSKH